MANIFVDPVIVITPPDDASKDEVEKWLTELTIWLQEALPAPFNWFHSVEATDALQDSERFPDFGVLRSLQRKYHLEINPAQIARRVHDFFRNEELDLKDHLKHLEYDIEPEIDSIAITPNQLVAGWPDAIRANLQLLLVHCCACKHIEIPFGQEMCIATLALANDMKEISVSVIILNSLPEFVRDTEYRISQAFPLIITPDDLLPLIDVVEIWAKGEQAITYAIKQQYKSGQSDPISTYPSFRLGPCFIESVNERGLDTNTILLRSIIRAAADVIADRARDISGYHLHKFRKSETPDSPQLTRDSDDAKAWRLMLQKHGAGWRLHYWQISTPEGSIIEFANICKESEREIY
jgi:hypothetical protein